MEGGDVARVSGGRGRIEGADVCGGRDRIEGADVCGGRYRIEGADVCGGRDRIEGADVCGGRGALEGADVLEFSEGRGAIEGADVPASWGAREGADVSDSCCRVGNCVTVSWGEGGAREGGALVGAGITPCWALVGSASKDGGCVSCVTTR